MPRTSKLSLAVKGVVFTGVHALIQPQGLGIWGGHWSRTGPEAEESPIHPSIETHRAGGSLWASVGDPPIGSGKHSKARERLSP